MLLVPPLNFAKVDEGVYRSGHPLPVNYPFLQSRKIQCVIYLGDRKRDENLEYYNWASQNKITVHHFHVLSVKEPFVDNDPDAIKQALEILLDASNHPILLHSNKGKHRVGVLVGAMRKMLQGWSLASISDEYSKFAVAKGESDMQFIELFQPTLKYNPKLAPVWLRLER